jgi:hypothetical protein
VKRIAPGEIAHTGGASLDRGGASRSGCGQLVRKETGYEEADVEGSAIREVFITCAQPSRLLSKTCKSPTNSPDEGLFFLRADLRGSTSPRQSIFRIFPANFSRNFRTFGATTNEQ